MAIRISYRGAEVRTGVDDAANDLARRILSEPAMTTQVLADISLTDGQLQPPVIRKQIFCALRGMGRLGAIRRWARDFTPTEESLF